MKMNQNLAKETAGPSSEQEHLRPQSNFQIALERLPCVTWIIERNCNYFIYLSPNVCQYFGYTRQDYLFGGYTFHKAAIHPDDINRVCAESKTFLEVLDENINKTTIDCPKISDYRVLTLTGDTLHIREYTSIFSRNAYGTPTHLISFLFDETAVKRKSLDEDSKLLIDRTCHECTSQLSKENQKINLTNREKEILQLLSEGKTSRDISRQLSISVHTVNTHRQKMLEKTGRNNIGAVISYAFGNGIIFGN